MKRERISIKWKVFMYFLGFTVLLLVILWLIQTVYLDAFYKRIKRNELENAMENLKSVQDMENIEEAVSAIADSYDISITVVNSAREVVCATEPIFTDFQGNLNQGMYEEWYQWAVKHGGSYMTNGMDGEPVVQDMTRRKELIMSQDAKEAVPAQTGDRDTMQLPDAEAVPPLGVEPKNAEMNHENFRNQFGGPAQHIQETVTWIQLSTNAAGEERTLILTSTITPVNATVHTLQIQLIYISVILVLLSLGVAWILSRNISKSIIKVNQAAKELASANYDVSFEAKDYREIAELSDTLNYATEELSKTENFQRELLANVSHDLRTPLTMIIAYSEIMRDLPGENTPENVQVVIEESKRLTALVNDMLDVSKLQAGVLALEKREYNLTGSIQSVLGRFAKLTEQNGYEISFNYEEQVLVEADEYKMNQVVYNLINNAINYTGEDKAVKVRQIQNGGIVRIEVTDTGIGIEKAELPYVWERYYKVDKTHKRAVTGTGLGLSIVKNILKLHEACYGVNSEVGKGSTFWFELPVRKVLEEDTAL